MPKRLILVANGYQFGGNHNNFTFILDVLLVPLSFNVQTCFDLHLEPFCPGSPSWFMGTRRLRDNIILLRKFAVQGNYLTCAADQFDIPEDLRNRPARLSISLQFLCIITLLRSLTTVYTFNSKWNSDFRR